MERWHNMRNLETIADNLKVENRFIHFDKDNSLLVI